VEHTEKTGTVLPPGAVPTRKGPKIMMTVAALAVIALFSVAMTGRNEAAQAETPCAAPTEVVVRQVKPIGLDRTQCVQFPYDGSTTCAAGQVGQKIVKVDGTFRRITCGKCLKFIYPDDETSVEITVKEGAR